jgi:hypothetical protein
MLRTSASTYLDILYAPRHLLHAMSTPTISVDQLKRAIVIAEQIEKLEAELNQILSGRASTQAPTTAKTKAAKTGKRTMSPEARAKIAAAQRARWAKSKGEAAKPAVDSKGPKSKKKQKGGMSAAGRAAIVAAQKARWAKVKAAKG